MLSNVESIQIPSPLPNANPHRYLRARRLLCGNPRDLCKSPLKNPLHAKRPPDHAIVTPSPPGLCENARKPPGTFAPYGAWRNRMPYSEAHARKRRGPSHRGWSCRNARTLRRFSCARPKPVLPVACPISRPWLAWVLTRPIVQSVPLLGPCGDPEWLSAERDLRPIGEERNAFSEVRSTRFKITSAQCAMPLWRPAGDQSPK
jgi:hypothetical protein